MPKELCKAGAAELAAMIRDRRVTSRQVVQAHLDRIQQVNPLINAITITLAEQALAQADQADQAVAQGKELGPLHGVPFTVKENIDLQGTATSCGVKAMAQALPARDAPAVSRLRQAGAIPLGHGNLPDFSLRLHTANDLYGATLNPRDPALSPGGSSGGEAAAVASGMTPLGIGNDYGGSIRVPAHCCGVLGIKPSRGRVADASSLAPVESPLTVQMFMCHGPLARKVEDLALALEVMSGPDPRDPDAPPLPWPGPAAPGGKVALVKELPGSPMHGQVTRGLEAAAGALSRAGYTVEEAQPPALPEAIAMWGGLMGAEMRVMVQPYIKSYASHATLLSMEYMLNHFPKLEGPAYMRALADLKGIARMWHGFFQEHPLILGPVSSQPPHPVDYDIAGQEQAGRLLDSMGMVGIVNALGLPSLAFPIPTSQPEPPCAVQLLAARWREDLCLAAGKALEDNLGSPRVADPKAL
jgi:amidase